MLYFFSYWVSLFVLISSSAMAEHRSTVPKKVFNEETLLKGISSENTEEVVSLAYKLAREQKVDEAIFLMEKSLERHPNHIDTQIALATFLSWKKHYDEAIQLYQQALQADPTKSDALIGWARVVSWKGNFKESINRLQQLLQKEPNNLDALITLGRVLSWDQQFEESEEIYKRALKQQPNNIEALKGLANTYKWNEKFSAGIEIEKKILKLNPQDVDAMVSIAFMYSQLLDYDKSIAWYEKASKMAPQRGDILANLGLLYKRVDQVDAAATAFQRAQELQEGDVKSYIALGRVRAWDNKIEESKETLRKALGMAPDDISAHNALAYVYTLEESWSEAEAEYKTSLDLDPYNREASDGLRHVQLLQAPEWTNRFNFEAFQITDTTLNNRLSESVFISTLSEEFLYKFSSKKKMEGRYQFAYHESKDELLGIQRYNVLQHIISSKLAYPLLFGTFLSGRYEYNLFTNQELSEFNLQNDQHFHSGFLLLGWDSSDISFLTSYSREFSFFARSRPNLVVEYLDNWGGSVDIDLPWNLNFISSLFFVNNQTQRDRWDTKEILTIRPSFLPKLEVGGEIQYKTHPSTIIKTASFKYQESLLGRLLMNGEYRFAAENNSENFGTNVRHTFRLLVSLPIVDWLSFNFDGKIFFDRDSSHDVGQVYRSYLTTLL